jgi:hypothetical protein
VVQQITYIDYGIYLGAIISREDNAMNLVCYPKPTRFLPQQTQHSDLFSIVKIDIPK